MSFFSSGHFNLSHKRKVPLLFCGGGYGGGGGGNGGGCGGGNGGGGGMCVCTCLHAYIQPFIASIHHSLQSCNCSLDSRV